MGRRHRSEGATGIRFFPDDWLVPIPLERLFGPGPAAGRPLEVDVGCGKGRFLLARAAAHPEISYLGIDRMLRRIRKVDRKAVRLGLSNLRLVRVEAYYAVTYLMPAACVSAYYILFPDPWPKKRHHDHRLFNPGFVNALYRTLRPGGQVHFATDHLAYFEEVKALIDADRRFESIPPLEPSETERTDFELLFLGQCPIGRYSFRRA